MSILLNQIMKNVSEVDGGQFDKLDQWIFEADEKGTHYSGMTYEQGMRDVLDVLSGNADIADLIE